MSIEASIEISRLDGGVLVVDGSALAQAFFRGDPSSVGTDSFDSLAGHGCESAITVGDLEAINRTMRTRSRHASWDSLLDRPLEWLAAIDIRLDLIEADAAEWEQAEGERLVRAALQGAIGPYRRAAVATKLLHLKRPRTFPILDNLVTAMLGRNIPEDASDSRLVDLAMELLLHLREQGRQNLESLTALQAMLRAEGMERSLVRILDGVLWFSHPAASIEGIRREFSVGSRSAS